MPIDISPICSPYAWPITAPKRKQKAAKIALFLDIISSGKHRIMDIHGLHGVDKAGALFTKPVNWWLKRWYL